MGTSSSSSKRSDDAAVGTDSKSNGHTGPQRTVSAKPPHKKLSSKDRADRIKRGAAIGSLALVNAGLSSLEDIKPEQLAKLRILDISWNNFKRAEVLACPHLATLKKLTVSHSQLTGDLGRCLEGFTCLESFIADNNQITGLAVLPATVTHLDLSCNALSEVPLCLVGHPAVVHVILNHNKIQKLPNLQTPALTELDLDNNALCLMDEDLSGMPNLQVLSLRYNRLVVTVLPSSLFTATRLDRLQIRGNDASFTQDTFLALQGVDQYVARRKVRIDKAIAGGVESQLGLLEE